MISFFFFTTKSILYFLVVNLVSDIKFISNLYYISLVFRDLHGTKFIFYNL